MTTSLVKNFSLASGTSGGKSDTVIAQYLVTKVAWWATYPRILLVTSSTLSTYNPETFRCTDQWEIADIEAVELSQTKNQFVLRLEKSRFRSPKLKFACSAQGHLLSLVARLRRQAQGKAQVYRLIGARRLHFRCIEQFADASTKLLFLQVTVSSIIFLEEGGRPVQILPFVYLAKVAFSTDNDEGMVLSTAFHDQVFCCSERHECMNEIMVAANEAGVELYKTSSEITALHLRLHNAQVLNRPSVVRFDVKKVRNHEGSGALPGSENSDAANKEIQLILQSDAVVEMHCSMRTVIARPYSALLAVVRPDWGPRTLVLEFKHEDTLILDVDGRDELVTILLLMCYEAGHHNVVLTPSSLNYCRFYHPHAADTNASDDTNVAGALMETFLLRRITKTSAQAAENNGGRSRGNSIWSPRRRRGGNITHRATLGSNDLADSDSNGRGSWFQRRINKNKYTTEPLYETRKSMESGVSMNDSVSIVIAMEELNANLRIDELTYSETGQIEVVNKAMELVFEHLVTLVASLRRYGDTTSSDLITTLQALLRVYHHPDASFTDEMIPHVLDAVHELILQQDILTCYWCLRLLQCFLDVRTPKTSSHSNSAGDRRAKMVQHFVRHATLQHAVVDLIPATFAASISSSFMKNSSAFEATLWMADLDVGSSASSSLSSAPSSTLCSKEARVQNEINVMFYEALLTLHHLLIHMQSAAKLQRTTRDRQNYVAAGNRQKHPSHDFDDLPAEKQTDALAGKLLEKYRFLVDSILDIRLVRMAETSVALVKFVLHRFATKPPDSPLQLSSPSDNQLPNSRARDFHESRKKWLGALGLFLDNYLANAESRTKTQLLQFGSGRTIEMPEHVFSYGTSKCTPMEELHKPETTNCLEAIKSNGSMRLEYLNPSEPSSSTRGKGMHTKPPKLEPRVIVPEPKQSRKSLKQLKRNETYGRIAPGDSQPYHCINDTSPTQSIGNNVEANIFGMDDEDDTVSPLLRSDHGPTAAQTGRQPSQASIRSRRPAGVCDACIGCNDVCTNERCYFCAEKEYQLKAAFGDSSEAAGPTVRQAAWQHCAPTSTDSSFNIDREYSSCEIKRHRSMRSCWIQVGDSIYDVTDLLGVHPGGAQVLLEAAQHGGDCGPILNTHPPAARKMLVQHRLGRYYECDNT
ncbi:hypothetical protein KXD40_001660 [Peronospora effusa]|uniref:Cytochrome b5 heme-binding domain-containing protein n=1 Tax=Peronospora effusa TaxID=542832 RepID=A0A3M6VUN3_9STRA|nr:hypothetical protein DD238_001508 [Peronospora effusa]RQM17139.1 hypothetical protein DD237_001915 [Peronospora effusa]UIZ26451.1 hypothetical protein KXD40_001660 [Peronospora effusa]CAI5712517.1 unnamed protein product [Peronospora effusa]